MNEKKETYVAVLDINGKPLMPTQRVGKVRRLLKDGLVSETEYVVFSTTDNLYEI